MLFVSYCHKPEDITAFMQDSQVIVEVGPSGHRLSITMTIQEASRMHDEIGALLGFVDTQVGGQDARINALHQKIARLTMALHDISRQPEGDEESAQAIARDVLRDEASR